MTGAEAPVQWQLGIRNWSMNLFLCFPPPPQHRRHLSTGAGPQIANVKVGGAGVCAAGYLFKLVLQQRMNDNDDNF